MKVINTLEVAVPVPWGQISVKAWGEPQDPPVLVIHGILDNAGSFDRLIPLLPTTFYYLCIDLPGHGKSSHFPPNMPIHSVDYILVYKLLAEYFKRGKYVVMGHSYGGQIASFFAQIYPDYVSKLVMLDTIRFYTISARYFKDYFVDRINLFLTIQGKLNSNKEPPSYTYDEAVNRIISGRAYPLSKDAAEALVQRMLIPVGNDRYTFSMDQRLKVFFNPLHDRAYALEILKRFPIQCPTIFILAKATEGQIMLFKPLLKHLQKQKNVLIKYVDGHHEIHNDNPSVVAPYITKFLTTNKSKL